MKKTLLATAVLALGGFSNAALADLAVAIAGPMTGQYASAGDQIRKGAEMAIADINARGGVLGQKLKLEVGDDACDPKQAVSVANTMVNKGIVFMHGTGARARRSRPPRSMSRPTSRWPRCRPIPR
jgi:branched-chain amino acid transport system substrate-binding protein